MALPDNAGGGAIRPSIALCIGGASCVHQDIADALDLFEPDFVVVCNDALTIWPGRVDAAVSLHPEKLGAWRDQRLAKGYPDADRYLVHGDYVPEWAQLVEFRLPHQRNSGSSGLFMVKAALMDLGADIAVLAGVPLDRRPHFFDASAWEAAVGYRAVWQSVRPDYKARIRSMSGWTAAEFGRFDGAVHVEQEYRQMGIKLDKIAYEPHPVTHDRKRELNAKGYKVVDIRFAPRGAVETVPDHAEPAKAEPTKAELIAMLDAAGVDYDRRWSVARLRKIAAGM